MSFANRLRAEEECVGDVIIGVTIGPVVAVHVFAEAICVNLLV